MIWVCCHYSQLVTTSSTESIGCWVMRVPAIRFSFTFLDTGRRFVGGEESILRMGLLKMRMCDDDEGIFSYARIYCKRFYMGVGGTSSFIFSTKPKRRWLSNRFLTRQAMRMMALTRRFCRLISISRCRMYVIFMSLGLESYDK